MASKSKKRGKKRPIQALLADIQKNLERGNYKQALKDARVCYANQATEEHRRFLEIAYIGRAQELQRRGDRDACRNVLERLLELGVEEPAVQASLPDTLLWAGMLDRMPPTQAPAAPQEAARWASKIADQEVLRPGSAPPSMPEIRDEAGRVRDALRMLFEGDQNSAAEQLKAVARDSPLADWRLFARGLAAYYEQDLERMQANWARLDSDRAAARIARALSAVSDAAEFDRSDPSLRDAVAKLERGIGAKSLTAQLHVLQRHAANGDWKSALQTLRGVGGPLRELDPQLHERLVDCLYSRVVRDGSVADVDRFVTAVPHPLDPNGNRARAIVRELFDDESPQAPLPFWRQYIDDLEGSTALKSDERALAQAMVWHHMAGVHHEEAQSLWNCTCGESHDEEAAEAVREAECCLENCLRLAPAHVPAYEALAYLCEQAGQMEKSVGAYRRALEHVPDYYDGMVHLVDYHLREEEPLEAQRYAEQACRAKPLDRGATVLLWSCHVANARFHARAQRFDQARAEFETADALLPDRSREFQVLGRKAILEDMAGCQEAARRLIEQAQEHLDEPTPLWLLMAIESARYGRPTEEVWAYELRWTKALKKRCRASTASLMCQLVRAHLLLAHQLPSEFVDQLAGYVKRCSRVKWQPEQLRDVCLFLDQIDRDDLLVKFVRKGLKQVPDDPVFHALNGHLEVSRGPFRCNRGRATKSLQAALALASKSPDSLEEWLAERARHQLAMLEDYEGQPQFSLPPGARFVPNVDDDGGDDFDPLPSPDGLPHDLISEFMAICDEMGLNPVEAMARLADGELDSEMFDDSDDQPRKTSRNKRRKG